jgi:hypothetical protein
VLVALQIVLQIADRNIGQLTDIKPTGRWCREPTGGWRREADGQVVQEADGQVAAGMVSGGTTWVRTSVRT